MLQRRPAAVRAARAPSARDLLDAVQMREQVREADFVGADSVRRGRVHARAALGSTRCEEACAMRSAIHRSISRLSQAETAAPRLIGRGNRSEEHTSELQSLMRISYA